MKLDSQLYADTVVVAPRGGSTTTIATASGPACGRTWRTRRATAAASCSICLRPTPPSRCARSAAWACCSPAGSPLRANTPICTGATGSGSRCCYAESLPGTQDARKKIGGEGWTRTNVDGVANRSMDPSATSPCWTALCRGKSNRRTAPASSGMTIPGSHVRRTDYAALRACGRRCTG